MLRNIWKGLLPLVFLSCSKEKLAKAPASLTIIPAVTGCKYLAPNFSATETGHFIYAPKYVYGDWSNDFRSATTNSQQPLKIYDYPDTTSKSKPVFDLQLDLPMGSISTLFLFGTKANPEYILKRESLPDISRDSAIGIRFANLSHSSNPISINIAGKAPGSEETSLPYKSLTSAFKKYEVKAGMADMVFEFRDATTGNLIATYTLLNMLLPPGDYNRNTWIGRNFTLALIGLPGATGADAQKVMLIYQNI